MKTTFFIFIFAILIFSTGYLINPHCCFSEDAWNSFEQSATQSWQDHNHQENEKWDRLDQAQADEWSKFRVAVEQKWDTFIDSTKKTWVDYGKNLDTRSEVNFENGTIRITALVSTGIKDFKGTGSNKLKKQIKKMFSSDNPSGHEVLKGQVRNHIGKNISSENLDQFIEEEIMPNIHVAKKPFKAKDGKERIKVTAKISLVPAHVRIRAEKYLGIVNYQATRFNVKPQLILAVIHTESWFNPMAKSSCDAIGLMQLIPKFGARDAYLYVYNSDRIVPASYLYNPDKNIELGTAYLYLLQNKHFNSVKDDVKNRYVSICGYNWGPTAMNRKIVSRYSIDQMESTQLYTLLREKTPQETRNYLKKVIERMAIYDNFY